MVPDCVRKLASLKVFEQRSGVVMCVFRKIISIYRMGILAARRQLHCYNALKRNNKG